MAKKRVKRGMSLSERRAKEKFEATMGAIGKQWRIQHQGESDVDLIPVWLYFCQAGGRVMTVSQLTTQTIEAMNKPQAESSSELAGGLAPLENLITQGFLGGSDLSDASGYVAKYFFSTRSGQMVKDMIRDGQEGIHCMVITWKTKLDEFWAKPAVVLHPGIMTPDEVTSNVIQTVETEKAMHPERF